MSVIEIRCLVLVVCIVYRVRYCLFFFFLMKRRPPRSTRMTHSFPTRRSSDLRGIEAGAEIEGLEILAACRDAQFLQILSGVGEEFRGRDRKSTRLNSSH